MLARVAAGAGRARRAAAGGRRRRDLGRRVQALDVTPLRIGPEIDPGVPWTVTRGARPLALALKSGNFGAPDFFTKALEVMP